MNRAITFLKNWTLPSAIVAGTVLYLTFAYIPALDSAARFFDPIFDTIFPLFMAMILFVTFCRVDFHKMRPSAWHAWITLLQVAMVALATAGLMASGATGNRLVLMESILTCIIAPGAAAAPVVTAKLGGNLETMTTYTFVSNFVTALMVPLVFPMIDQSVHISFWVAFFAILYKVCMVLLVPMAAAYVVKHYCQRLHAWILSVPDLSFYMWGISLTIVTGSTIKYILHAGTTISFVLLIACGAICYRTCCWQAIRSHSRGRTGAGAEKHSFCRVDCLHLPQSAVLGGAWVLHPVAKRRQQLRNLAPCPC